MLTVVSVAYPPAPVGADAVGGAEQILTLIDEALAAAGARSIVIAAEGSTCAGELRAIPRPRGTLDEAARREAQAHARAAIARTLDERAVDVVHLHGLDFAAYLPPPGPRVVVTLHLPPAWYSPRAFAAALERRDVSFVCVSAAQRAACPAGLEPIVIANGVAVERFAGRRRRLGFALGLGRVCPEKGWHLAIDACARAGVPLVLGGRVFEYTEHERYFREQVAPRLGAGVRFAGALGAARKRRLLGAARALIAPSLAPETSSLAAMEALASGTPVVALRAGALGEIVEHGRTGFLADSVDELADGLRRAGEIDAALCRSTALARFDAAAMTARYLDLYRRLPRPAPRAEQPHDEQRRPEQLHVEQLRVARLHGEQTLDEQSYGEQTCGERILDERTLDEQTRGERTLDERTLGEPTRREPTRREPTRREPTLDERTRGEPTLGERTRGEQTLDERARGEQTSGEYTRGEQTLGERARGEQTSGEHTRGEQTSGEHTCDERTCGEQTCGERTRGEQTSGEQARGGQQLNVEWLRVEPLRDRRLRVEELASVEALAGIAGEWRALWERCAWATPFQAPEWLLAWCRHLGGGCVPRALALREGARLVGLLPLGEWPDGELALLGRGVTDYLDVLLEDAHAERGAGALVAHLNAPSFARFAVCRLDDLRPASPLAAAAPPPGWSAADARGEPCPIVRLPPSAAELERALPRGRWARVREDRRRAERFGLRAAAVEDRAGAEAALEALFALHGARWRSRGEPGVMAGDDVRRFHRDAALRSLARGELLLHALHFPDGRIAAVLYGYRARRRAHTYLCGFDAACARFSPGLLLIAHALEAALAAGAVELDFLRGGERYKYWWGAADRWNLHRVLRRDASRS